MLCCYLIFLLICPLLGRNHKMMDEEYDTQIEEADFKKLRTVQAVYDACTKK